jgi:hypothetical protein
MLMVVYTSRVPCRLASYPHRGHEQRDQERKNPEDSQHLEQRESAARSQPGTK